MTIQQAIKKAIEGGYQQKENHRYPERFGNGLHGISEDFCIFETLSDPTFWQSLGKAMGWKSRKHHLWPALEIIPKDDYEVVRREQVMEDWFYHWHRLIDFLAEGKTIEQFFEGL